MSKLNKTTKRGIKMGKNEEEFNITKEFIKLREEIQDFHIEQRKQTGIKLLNSVYCFDEDKDGFLSIRQVRYDKDSGYDEFVYLEGMWKKELIQHLEKVIKQIKKI